MYLTCTDGEGLPYTDIEKTNLKVAIKQGFKMYSKDAKKQKKMKA